MENDPTARALTLLAILQPGTEWTATALADRLGTSARTVRRDID
ncbi:HTH domain-containing protein [Prescottella soli]|uniref:HTH domain-containing protein n=1 Tax=Prescottella soli TaxID=1543852 RepID=A0ABW9FRH2_9NOCA